MTIIASQVGLRTILILTISGAILLDLSACEEEPEDETLEIGKVYTPTNDYLVSVWILIDNGVLDEMNIIVLDQATNAIPDAQVIINDEIMPYAQKWDMYCDTNLVLDYSPGTVYNLSVSVGGQQIAEGIAQMPTIPAITSHQGSATHLVNQPLAISFNESQYATLTYLYLDFWNPDLPGSYSDTTLVISDPGAGSYILQEELFQYPGQYKFWLTAISGLTTLPAHGFAYSEFPQIGNNIKGPRGYFLVGASSNYIKLTVSQ